MKKIFLVAVFSLIATIGFANTNEVNNTKVNKKKVEVVVTTPVKSVTKATVAHCSINVEGFSASGGCRAVLRAYRRWKEMQ